jgi:hypothetical protein
MSAPIKIGMLVWLLGIIFLFWIHPIYVLLFSVFMLVVGVLVYVLENWRK